MAKSKSIAVKKNSAKVKQSKDIPTYPSVLITDQHAEPFVKKGQYVVFDPDDTQPQNGFLFMTRTDAGNYCVVGAVEIDGQWFARTPKKGRKVVGPMDTDFFRSHILGKCLAAASSLGRLDDIGS